MSDKTWRVYLSGEIHSDWRQRITDGVARLQLPVRLDAPICVHEHSDDCAAAILGPEDKKFWYDNKAASMNAMRIRTLIEDADIVVVRFGDKYRQWNAAFDAGMAAALGKSIITLHDESLTHPLKEVDAAASAVCETPEQVVQTLAYVIRGDMPSEMAAAAE